MAVSRAILYAFHMGIETKPTWKDAEREGFYPLLQENTSAEVIIVGAGLAGVLTAYKLAKAGKQVVVLEKKKIGSGATEYTTAFLTNDIDTDLIDLVKMFGKDKAQLVWESHAAAISEIEHIAKEENIDCGFKRVSSIVYTNKEDGALDFQEEVELASDMGFAVSLHPHNDFNFKNFGYMETKNQAKYHPLKFLFGLAEAARKYGVKFYEDTEVVETEQQENVWYAKTKEGFWATGTNLILTTYYPLQNPVQTLFKKGMYVSYVMEALIPKGMIPENIYWDDANPYHYFRIDAYNGTHDRMIIGGEDHRAEIKIDEEKNYAALEAYLRSIVGENYQITRKWNGPILEPSDGLALIGETYPNQYVATAFSGNGMTYSGVASILLTDLVLARKNIWTGVYDPKRVPSLFQLFKKGSDYLGELFGGAGQNIFKSPRQA
ncbi:MAG TPA: FAD-dependent oxidoreductase [Candidatus Binatia bacterium]|nr:FAD-dependent oxidoreductase [Candidatus Binatia bacterium]